MGRGQYRDERLGVDGRHLQPVRWIAVAQNPSVERAVQQPPGHTRRERLIEMQTHPWVGLPVCPEDTWECCQHPRADKAEVQSTDLAATDAPILVDIALHDAQGALGPLQKSLARTRQTY